MGKSEDWKAISRDQWRRNRATSNDTFIQSFPAVKVRGGRSLLKEKGFAEGFAAGLLER